MNYNCIFFRETIGANVWLNIIINSRNRTWFMIIICYFFLRSRSLWCMKKEIHDICLHALSICLCSPIIPLQFEIFPHPVLFFSKKSPTDNGAISIQSICVYINILLTVIKMQISQSKFVWRTRLCVNIVQCSTWWMILSIAYRHREGISRIRHGKYKH